jgi:hypothetical protein
MSTAVVQPMQLDLRPAHRFTATISQRFVEEGLRPAYAAAAEAFDPRAYDARELRRGRRAWAARACDEYRSHIGFIHLLSDMAEAGLPFDLIATGTRVVRDEARHVELCRRLVVALGGDNAAMGTPAMVRADPRLPAAARVLHQVVGSLCIGETLSVRMLSAVMQRRLDPLAAETLRVLTTDEALHGRFGWAVLEAVLPELDARAHRAVQAWLPRFLLEAERAFAPRKGPGDDALVAEVPSPFGSLPPAERDRLFDHYLRRDVLARFDDLGLQGSAAWERAQALRAAA